MLSDTRLSLGETPELKERVVAAMETHATDASVQEYAAATIQQLAATRTCVLVALPVAAVAVAVWLCGCGCGCGCVAVAVVVVVVVAVAVAVSGVV